ncbi:MAG: 50S ribosomal protein L25/general stress protein Ctc [Caryophanon sp.]|nr:50S ribosomal protein L25/general stress protein Ctc [Caryophanon sp.]
MNTVITANKRETGSHSILTQLRNEGKLPSVIYGYNVEETTPVYFEYKEMAREVQRNGINHIFKIKLDGTTYSAIINEIQRDALKNQVKHFDLLSINMKEELEVDVPISIVGESVGVKEGGVLTQPNVDLKIRVKPSDIPDSIEVDISELGVGDTLSLADVRDKIKFEILNDDDYTLATVTPPTPPAEDVDPEDAAVTADDVEATGEKLDPGKPGRED